MVTENSDFGQDFDFPKLRSTKEALGVYTRGMAGLAHFGFGFAFRSMNSRISLGWYLLGAMWLDVIYIIASLLPVNQELAGYVHHSLAGAVFWTLAAAAITRLAVGNWKPALLMAAAVFSHWVLDAVTWPMTAVMEEPTGMPLWFAPEPSIGLGLYRTLAGVIIGEIAVLGGGLFAYVKKKKSERRNRV